MCYCYYCTEAHKYKTLALLLNVRLAVINVFELKAIRVRLEFCGFLFFFFLSLIFMPKFFFLPPSSWRSHTFTTWRRLRPSGAATWQPLAWFQTNRWEIISFSYCIVLFWLHQ